MTKQIPLTQDKVAIVDDDDYDELNKHKWSVLEKGNTYYAIRWMWSGGNQSGIYMHRAILGLMKGDDKIVDHVNRNGLDNRQQNLRVVSHAINIRNHNRHKHNTSGHNGVCWHKASGKWDARITVKDKQIHLGLYDTIKDAVEARRQGEIEHWGKICVC